MSSRPAVDSTGSRRYRFVRADAAMYAAKRGGRNRVVVASDALQDAPGRRALQQ